MSGEEPMASTHDCGSDAAAYALGALEPAEAEQFRAHMDTCVVCRDEVMAFQQVADALPMAAPQQPVPRGLRRRVLGQVHEEARAASRAAPSRRRVLMPRPALAGGLAAALAVATAGVIALASGGSGTAARVIAASVGHAELRLADGHAELVVNKLPQPASGHIYEVWLQRGAAEPSPTKALFSVTSTGSGDVDVPGNLHGVSEVLVTEEPGGGSPFPTTPPVIVAHLS